MTQSSLATLQHLSQLLGVLQSKQYKGEDPNLVSGVIKRSLKHERPRPTDATQQRPKFEFKSVIEPAEFKISNFEVESRYLEWVGVSFGSEFAAKLHLAITRLGRIEKVSEIRFWGVIQGTNNDYYVAQGVKDIPKAHVDIIPSAQKPGQGVNYYSFWVCNNPLAPRWELLPDITPNHIKIARKIKRVFSGDLNSQIASYPPFEGSERHYLKAQICRITHSLELVPKGLYKKNDENPKVIQFEDEAKVPEVQELNSLEGWFHRNQMILGLGRCSHYVDLSLPEEQIDQAMSSLAENDPEVERLLGITEDKVPEALNLGIQNPWRLRLEGDPQIFTKEDANYLYGIPVLRNAFWPGWTTIGYKNGFTNFYIGNGLKLTQPSWDTYSNEDLQEETAEVEECSEPNPKEEPKVEEPVAAEEPPEDD